jgi:hypothetical protein
MLGYFTPHKQYLQFALAELRVLAESRPDQIREYQGAISKMLILNLDPLLPIISPLYPPTGKMALRQMEIFRSFVLMEDLLIPLNNWVDKLAHNPVLRVIAGFAENNLPATSSYYDFINRTVPLDERPATKTFKAKPKEKLGKGEKLPPRNPGVIKKLTDRLIKDEKHFMKLLSRRPERFLQNIFARVSVDASVELGLVPQDADVSGDGTCMETGASHYGRKICDCAKNGIYKCDCPRRFSDPNATWGWDSHNGHYFYGYTGYFISTHNKPLKLDLPLYLRLVEASRHDSVSAVFALAEFRELCPNIRINTFISDSASDNYATYELLNHWDINAVIALNPKNKDNFRYPPAIEVDDKGTPLCPGGRRMVFNGFCKDRCRFKWRCPRAAKGCEPCEACSSCSPSSYGRVIYTKPEWDLRLFTRIPRSSDLWKEKMRQRTAAERVNNRILNDYGIENASTRGKKRISFFTTIAAMNIHLDAQLKFMTEHKLFNLNELLHIEDTALAA